MAFHGVILCGGFGTRLTPRSSSEHPKQFQDLLGTGKTMVQATAERLHSITHSQNMVVTNTEQAKWVKEQLPDTILIEEPESKNTAPAIGLAAIMLKRQDSDAVMAVLPCDHHFQNEDLYSEVLKQALDVAQSRQCLVTIGLEPTWAHPKLGYIQYGKVLDGDDSYQVVRFCEKPGTEKAEEYLSAGNFVWNSGQFFWHVDVFLDELERCHPTIHGSLMKIADSSESKLEATIRQEYSLMEKISVDYAVMEKSAEKTAVVLGKNLGWNDIGSWDVWGSLIPADQNGNHSQGPVEIGRSRDCIVYSDSKKLVLNGLEGVIVVHANGHTLVTRNDLAAEVGILAKEFSSSSPKVILHGVPNEISVEDLDDRIVVAFGPISD